MNTHPIASTEAPRLTTCPYCGGRGYSEGFINARPRHFYGRIACTGCNGSGQVDEATATRCAFGEVMLDDRRQRRMTIRQEAARLGVDFGEWSRIENGREPETEAGRAALAQRKAELEAI